MKKDQRNDKKGGQPNKKRKKKKNGAELYSRDSWGSTKKEKKETAKKEAKSIDVELGHRKKEALYTL